MMKLNIGYFADGPWSHQAFEKLINDDDILIKFICVRRGTNDQTLKAYCQKYNIDYLKDKDVNSKVFLKTLSKYNCDMFVSMSFNQIFKRRIINLTRYGIINCHAGKLPFYRGRNILNWALINDENEFGITVHYVDEGIDTGDIILQKLCPITSKDDYSTLLFKAYSECANVLYEAITLFKNGAVVGLKQTEIHPAGFYCTKRQMGDELIDWNQSSKDVFNFIRSICLPGPIARAFINGIEVKINRSELVSDPIPYKCITGAILNIDSSGLLVKTRDSFIKITEYTPNDTFKVGDRFEIK